MPGVAVVPSPREDVLHFCTDVRVVAAPQIALGRVATGFAHGGDDRIGRLDALCFFQLAQIVPCGEKDNLVGIDDAQALGVAIVAQKQRAFPHAERIRPRNFKCGALSYIARQSAPLRFKKSGFALEYLRGFDSDGINVGAISVDYFLRTEFAGRRRRLVKYGIRDQDR